MKRTQIFVIIEKSCECGSDHSSFGWTDKTKQGTLYGKLQDMKTGRILFSELLGGGGQNDFWATKKWSCIICEFGIL